MKKLSNPKEKYYRTIENQIYNQDNQISFHNRINKNIVPNLNISKDFINSKIVEYVYTCLNNPNVFYNFEHVMHFWMNMLDSEPIKYERVSETIEKVLDCRINDIKEEKT